VVGLLILGALALAGCAEPMAIAAVPPTATVYPPPPTDIPLPPPGPTPAALDFPLPAPAREAVEPVGDQTCVDCHTDEETLRAVATEVEQEESLSEGEG
jgi:PBP1b-binding outer membrane lipoprotein LpoB